ncbi:MAG: hypothetical protein K1X79_08335 [Oligoflexia bacterium]|nr:hypothetical protein [Oligoflexia bacterium]
MTRFLIKSFACLGLCSLIACNQSTIKSYPSLANQGMLPLSTSNPYVAGNLFLAREAELSPFLYNFLKIRGGPTAVEIIEPNLGESRVIMYYPRDRQVYTADIVETKTTRNWMIKGPYQIERKDYRELATLENSMQGEPVFVIRGKQQRFKFETPNQETKIIQPSLPAVPLPTPTPKPKRHISKPKEEEDTIVISKRGNSPTEFRPLNSDQQAIQMSLGYAERAENGDVIHTVIGGENLAAIAKWYTGTADNATGLAEANGIKVGDTLTSGARIRVPLKLVKNTRQMKPE